MKKGNSGKGGFGAPKPLPGQPGYKVSETATLEKDAIEMEMRLKMLQEKMAQQQQQEASKMGNSGTLWKSSRPDKGSVRSYGKDVQEKHRRKMETLEHGGMLGVNSIGNSNDGSMKGTAAARRNSRQASAGDFHSKDVEHWTVADVGEWLKSVMLDQYQTIFAQNEVNGPIFVDLALEDLDYMNITVLGHRKIILKGAQELRKNSKLSNTQPNISLGPSRTKSDSKMFQTEDDSSISVTKSMNAAKDESSVRTTHWSQLEPLSANVVTNKEGYNLANAADNDVYDEEAERKAFMEAVGEWRKEGPVKKLTIVREYLPPGQQEQVITKYSGSEQDNSYGSDDGMWKNPFAVPVGSDRSQLMDDSDDEATTKKQVKVEIIRDADSKGQHLGDGILDEDKEHEEFRKAVDAWRSGNKTSNQIDDVGAKGTNSGETSTQITQQVSSAERLAKELEKEQLVAAEKMEQQRQEAELRLLKATKELEIIRKNRAEQKEIMEKAEDRQQNEYKDGSETKDTYSEYKNSDPAPYTYSHKPHSNFLSFSSDGFASSTRTDESPRTYIARSEDGTIVKQMMDFNDDGISQHEQYADTTVAISLVESTIRRENNPPKEDTTCYVVDYGSDED